MNRRHFLAGVAAVGVAARLPGQTSSPSQASVRFGGPETAPVPANFTGLSYESAQLANPAFFSSRNRQLVHLFRELAPAGNLRLGGGSSEFTRFQNDAPVGPLPFEVFGPDTSKTVKHGTVTSALALHNLRGFLDAVNWSCLYGLNLGQGTVENALAEAKAVATILGPRLLAFQIGNEPDSFRNRYRPATYSPQDYLAEWVRFHDAIAAAVPAARFAGPDISNKLDYLRAFAAMAPQYPDIILLTSHYYAMGPARSPEATLDNLLSPDPKLTTLKARDIHVIAEAEATAHLPYRMSEGNSCWDGGKAGVSDTFASALWAASYMLTCMGRGWVGVNFHGGGNGFYTPIAGAPSTGFTRRPEFFGIQFGEHFCGTRLLATTLQGAALRVDAFAIQREGNYELVLVNKTPEHLAVTLPQGTTAKPYLQLAAPGIDAKEGVQLKHMRRRHRPVAEAPGYSAVAFHLAGNVMPSAPFLPQAALPQGAPTR